MRILSVSEMHALETTADMAGHSYSRMMELAGKSVALAILQQMAVKERYILALVGPGNNGGDGLVAARLLQEAGAKVTAYLTSSRDPEQDAVFKQAQACGITIITPAQDPQFETLQRLTAQAHVIIDSLLGTGATPPLRGTIATVLQNVKATLIQAATSEPLLSLNRAPKLAGPRPLIVAVDGPSGLDFDSGDIDPLALKAHISVTFAAPKWGHFRLPGADYVGELVVADIGIPKGIDFPGTGPEVATRRKIQQWLPERPLNAHKGTFGKALIVAGSVNYSGAAILAASAAVRAGAGLVTLAIPNVLHTAIVPALPEATYVLLPHTLGVLDTHAAAVLMEKMPTYSAMLIGPGLSHTPETTAFLRRLLGLESGKRSAGFVPNAVKSGPERLVSFPPLIIDADGLNILSEIADWSQLLPPNTILTPHPGEMARLTGKTTAEIQANRLNIAQEYAATWRHVVVLKGAFTVIAAPEGRTMVLPFANPGLGTGGTGDVLAGTIVALRAQGLEAFEAAAVGAYLHALAGEIMRERIGLAGAAAGDVAHALPEAIKRIMVARSNV